MTISTGSTFGPALLAQLNGASSSSNATPTAGASGSGSGSSQVSTLDYLNLMMTQLQNQDPTKPMDSSTVMGQLAQFGTVQGINNLNTSFSTLSSKLVSSQALQASSLLGNYVLAPASTAAIGSGGGINGAVSLPAAASNVTVQIVNAAGATVQTLTLGNQPAGTSRFSWDGSMAGGGAAPAGAYTIVASGSVAGQGQQLSTLVRGQVQSITMNSSGASGLTLQVAGLGAVPFSSVQQID
jgi:flagellar basal-body rod modification protein FlgD